VVERVRVKRREMSVARNCIFAGGFLEEPGRSFPM
jgi:hypothetical protein